MSTQDKPQFEITNPAVAADTLRELLGTGPLAGLYRRDGLLVHTPRIGEDGYEEPSADETARGVHHGPAQVQPVQVRHVRALLDVLFDVGRVVPGKNGEPDEWVECLFPSGPADSAVNAAELGIGCPNLRTLHGIAHTPVVRPDGSVLAAPGYDDATGLLYLPDAGLTVPEVPEKPTPEQVADAMAYIREPVASFPWAGKHDEANWLGAMLTPVMRLLLPPPYPMVVITATNPGSGKTYLMRLVGIVHGIVTRGEFPREREELRKLLVSTLLSTTAPVIGMDNVRGTIYSSELEAMLTARTLTDRYLGQSKTVTVTNDRLWVVTGNNARIGGDLARRVLPVALDPGCPEPHKRHFDVNPITWMEAHRGKYLAALLTVVRGWVMAGRPEDRTRTDDYADWHAAMRGLLTWAGVPGTFGGGGSSVVTVAEDDQEWGVFVAELLRVFSRRPFGTREITDGLSRMPAMPGAIDPGTLPGDLADKWDRAQRGSAGGFSRSLGKWLAYRDGRFTSDAQTVRMRPRLNGHETVTFSVQGRPTAEEFLAEQSEYEE